VRNRKRAQLQIFIHFQRDFFVFLSRKFIYVFFLTRIKENKGDPMRIKRKLDMDRYETMLRDLEQMREKEEISTETYEEMKQKYEEKLKELEEQYFEDKRELELDLEELGDLGERITAQVEAAVSKAMDKVHRITMQFPDSFESGAYHSAEEVFEGKFESDTVDIDFLTENGHIDLRKWDNDTYKIVVTKKVRALSKERAEEKLKEVDVGFEHLKDGKDTLKLHAPETSAIVSIAAYLPADTKEGMLSRTHSITYNLSLSSENGHASVAGLGIGEAKVQTENGRIGFEGVSTTHLNAETENGRILVEDSEVETGTLSTENGRVELLNARGTTINLSTENGSVRGKMTFEKATLETENGSIHISPKGEGTYIMKTEMGSISIDVDRSVPHEISAETRMGAISVASDLNTSSAGRHHTVVKSPDLEEAQEKLSIEASTEMGSIRIQ
jgi:DUF4097 and DUF4098 domain-containing protein YvlB